jgi:hypothetical protein
MKFRTSLFFIFFLVLPLSYGVELINEPFDYADAYTNHGWSFSAPFADFPTVPSASFYSTNAFAYSKKSTVASNYEGQIYQSFSENVSTGTLTLSYDVAFFNDSTVSNDASRVTIYINGSTSGNDRFILRVNPYYNGINLTVTSLTSSVEPCSGIILNGRQNLTASISLAMDITNNRYTAYMNGSVVSGCEDKKIHVSDTPVNVKRILFSIFVDSLEYLDSQVDNILVTWQGANTSLADTGEPCQTDDDCASGKCEYGSCVLKQQGVPCIYSTECASGDCHNGLCTKPSLSQNLDNAMNDNFGDDAMSKNIVSIVLMVGIPAVVAIASGGASIAILLALALFVGEGFLFTLMGWLSPFIVLGIVVVCLIVMVFAFMIKGG